jgi:hypothetical protein
VIDDHHVQPEWPGLKTGARTTRLRNDWLEAVALSVSERRQAAPVQEHLPGVIRPQYSLCDVGVIRRHKDLVDAVENRGSLWEFHVPPL